MYIIIENLAPFHPFSRMLYTVTQKKRTNFRKSRQARTNFDNFRSTASAHFQKLEAVVVASALDYM